MIKTKFNVYGMSCSACSQRVEKAVKDIDGVSFVSVSLINNSMMVEYDESLPTQTIITAVKNAGYNATLLADTTNKKDSESFSLLYKLIPSVILLLILVYFAMGKMLGLYYPFNFDKTNIYILAIIEFIISTIVLIINNRFFTSGIKNLIKLSPNMDSLVAVGSGISYLYSVYLTVLWIVLAITNNTDKITNTTLYYEGATMIVTFVTIGKTLESFSKNKTKSAIDKLKKLSPKQATILLDNNEQIIDVKDIKVGDIIVLKSGDIPPVDGVIISGNGTFDESAISGESIPVTKTINDKVFSATTNLNGYILIKATTTIEDCTLQKIINSVIDASMTKAPIQNLADKISGYFVPGVMGVALITFIVWLIISKDFSLSLTRGVAVLVVSCPCALGLATPVAIMVGSGKGATLGLLYKNALALEKLGDVNAIVFDKTGTLTEGKLVVDDYKIYIKEQDFYSIAYSMESKSNHPIAKAITSHFNGDALTITDFSEVGGYGLKGKIKNDVILCGNLKLMKESAIPLSQEQQEYFDEHIKQGKTPILFAKNSQLIGIVFLSDKIKPTTKSAIEKLKELNIDVFMLSGDKKEVAFNVGESIGIDRNNVFGEVLPNGKKDIIEKLKEKYFVAMVGDGINDAPSITSADIGIAIGSGKDIAVESSMLVVANDDIESIVDSVMLSKMTKRIIKENLFWAFIYNIIAIPIASGVFTFLGLTISPSISALCMSLSSVSVTLNALRINSYKSVKNKVIKDDKKEDNMTKTYRVNGMMCGHCEKHVVDSVSKIVGVVSATADHTNGTLTLTLCSSVDEQKIKDAIESQGYEFFGEI